MNLDDTPAQAKQCQAMIHVLGRRGPDGSHFLVEGPLALGYTLLATRPDRYAETLPLVDKASGCVITADCRLDRNCGLEEKLGQSQLSRESGDGGLILQSYLRWGPDCVEHLRGDFAFVIFDPRNRTLFCARDQVGMRQLIYHCEPGKIFAFATEAEALLRHDGVPKRLNEHRVADYFESLEAYDLSSTFFEGLHRLPPATAMVVSRHAVKQWRYWELEEQPLLKLGSDADYADAFLSVFERAVERRLESSAPVAAMLSGGMDSGSVCAVAAKALQRRQEPLLATFSATGGGIDCPESRAIAENAAALDHVAPNFVSYKDLGDMREDLVHLAEGCAEPFDVCMNLTRAVYLAAKRAGKKVVLDGACGDTTFAVGDMIGWYRAQGKLVSAVRQARGERRFWGSQPRSLALDFVKQLALAITPTGLVNILHDKRRRRGKRRRLSRVMLSPRFAATVDIERRLEGNFAHTWVPPEESYSNRAMRLLHPYATVGRERYDRVASAFGIEPRDPFLDLDVLQFMMSLPPDQLEQGGWPKFILRTAMDGRLPDSVIWRAGKEHLGADFTEQLLDDMPTDPPAQAIDGAQAYLDLDKNPELLTGLPGSKPIDEGWVLRYWLVWYAQLQTLVSKKD